MVCYPLGFGQNIYFWHSCINLAKLQLKMIHTLKYALTIINMQKRAFIVFSMCILTIWDFITWHVANVCIILVWFSLSCWLASKEIILLLYWTLILITYVTVWLRTRRENKSKTPDFRWCMYIAVTKRIRWMLHRWCYIM